MPGFSRSPEAVASGAGSTAGGAAMAGIYDVTFSWDNGPLDPYETVLGHLTLHNAFAGEPTGKGLWMAGGLWSWMAGNLGPKPMEQLYPNAPPFWQEDRSGTYYWEGGPAVVLTVPGGDDVWRVAVMREVSRASIFRSLKEDADARRIRAEKYRLRPPPYPSGHERWADQIHPMYGWGEFTAERNADRRTLLRWTLERVQETRT